MPATLQDVFQILQEIKAELPAIIANTQIAPNQIVIVKGLSELSDTLGLLMAGEFRAGNAKEPGFGFTGVRIGYPPFSYSSESWHIAGVSNDVIQFGLNADDGTAWAGAGAIRLTSGGILVYNGATQTGAIEADGDVKFGSDISAVASTSILVFANAQTYNSESFGAGDILIGDNSTGKGNLFWDSSAGILYFRTGTTVMNSISSGSLVAVGCRVTATANQTIATDTVTAVLFTSEDYDDVGFHDTGSNTSRITIPTGYGGRYNVGHYIEWAANSTGYRNSYIYKNGGPDYLLRDIQGSADVLGVPTNHGTVEAALAAGDYIEVVVLQNSGGNVDIISAAGNNTPAFWITKIR